MAWRCSGASNAELITKLRGAVASLPVRGLFWLICIAEAGLITTDRCEKAMLATDRAKYVRLATDAYIDAPSGIGHAATISAPQCVPIYD
jgi:protein-L-isoaspartate(D-aspartate) O-methyltransferase